MISCALHLVTACDQLLNEILILKMLHDTVTPDPGQ